MEKNNNISGNGEKAAKKKRFNTLIIEGTRYRTRLTPKYQNRGTWITPDENLITSIIPGTIVEVLVQEGQEIREGDSLLILESMKMRNQVVSPRDGTVKSIHVKSDETIPKNHVMIELN